MASKLLDPNQTLTPSPKREDADSGGRNAKLSEDGVRQLLEKKEGLFSRRAAKTIVCVGCDSLRDLAGTVQTARMLTSTYEKRFDEESLDSSSFAAKSRTSGSE